MLGLKVCAITAQPKPALKRQIEVENADPLPSLVPGVVSLDQQSGAVPIWLCLPVCAVQQLSSRQPVWSASGGDSTEAVSSPPHSTLFPRLLN